MEIRRYEYELTIEDILEYPVWEFAFGEESDIIKIKPLSDESQMDINLNRLIVRATFIFVTGLKKTGYIKPINTIDTFMGHLSPVDLLPVILTENGQVDFWYGSHKPKRKLLRRNYELLGSQPNEIFPITVKSDIKVINGVDNGIIEGFLYCNEEDVEDFFHLKPSEIRSIT
jgi:hypothetical protein